MNNYNLFCNGEKDLSSVAEMAQFSFGTVITENEFIQRNLPAIVRQLVLQSQVKSKFTIKAVHSILALFGVNTRGLRKHEELRMFIEAAFIHICHINNVHEADHCPDVQTFKQNYGNQFFCSLDDKEVERLLKYRNYMAVAVKYIQPEQNRDYLLDLITRLAEGCLVRYVPGSGATLATRNRIDIYRKEGCVRKKVKSSSAPLLSVNMLPPISATAPLKRGRSLDEGGMAKRGCPDERGDGSKVWAFLEEDSRIIDLFTPFELGGSFAGDELDVLLRESEHSGIKMI